MHPIIVLGAIFGGVAAFGRERTDVRRSGVIVAPRRALDDKQLALNQLTQSCALSQQASALLNQGVPLQPWQKSKIAVIEDNLQSVLRGLAATQQRPSLGFSPSSGVDEALRADMASYANERAVKVRSLRRNAIHLAQLVDAQEDAQDAVEGLEDAINALRGAAGQLQRTQRGASEGSRNRLRRLIEATGNLLGTYFQGASDSWQNVLPPLPQTPIGSERSSFGHRPHRGRHRAHPANPHVPGVRWEQPQHIPASGVMIVRAAPMSAYVTVETDDGPVRISAASALSSEAVSDLADGIIDAATSIQDFAFRSQRRTTFLPGSKTHIPILPSASDIQALQSQSSLIPGGLL